MDRLREINKRINDLKEEWENLIDEREKLVLQGLDLTGKYIYLDVLDYYMHVGNFWYSYLDHRLVLEGEVLSSHDDYVLWDKGAQKMIPLRPGDEFKYTEITKKDWENKLREAIKYLGDEYTRIGK